MKPGRKALLPLLVLSVGLLATTALVAVRPEAKPSRPEIRPPLVEVVHAEPRTTRLAVRAQGTVEPRTESDLVAEVSGRIVWVSPRLDAGGFFDAGEVLVRIDPTDHRMAVERTRAAFARAESQLALARATLERRRSLRSAGASSSASLDEAVSAERVAAANLREARAALGQAELDLARTQVSAPFEGRVRSKRVDVGQFVTRGAAVARVYAVDYVEIRLPIPNHELAFLDLPLGYRDEPLPSPGPPVRLTGRFAGREHTWIGHIVRTEAALDPRTRMVNAVARVDAPYARSDDPERPPLPVGLFVEAEIEGRSYEALFALPRSALRGRDELVLIDARSRMRPRRVELLRADGETVWVRSGLSAGERVCVTALDVVVEGMQVRVLEAQREPASEDEEAGAGGAS